MFGMPQLAASKDDATRSLTMVLMVIDWIASMLHLLTAREVRQVEEVVCVSRNGIRECVRK